MTTDDAIPRDEVLVTLFLAAGGRLEDVLPPRWLAELASVVAYSGAVFDDDDRAASRADSAELLAGSGLDLGERLLWHFARGVTADPACAEIVRRHLPGDVMAEHDARAAQAAAGRL